MIELKSTWRPIKYWKHQHVGAIKQQWLCLSTSMTAALKRYTSHLTVTILKQNWQQPFYEERKFLGLRTRRWCWVREVELGEQATPWVFARTIIPRQTWRCHGTDFTGLKNRPLGELLFADPTFERQQLEITKVFPNHYLFYELPKQKSLWARRSLCWFRGDPLMIQEVFLPEFPFFDG